jgi:hypothetical protein
MEQRREIDRVGKTSRKLHDATPPLASLLPPPRGFGPPPSPPRLYPYPVTSAVAEEGTLEASKMDEVLGSVAGCEEQEEGGAEEGGGGASKAAKMSF